MNLQVMLRIPTMMHMQKHLVRLPVFKIMVQEFALQQSQIVEEEVVVFQAAYVVVMRHLVLQSFAIQELKEVAEDRLVHL